MYDDQNIFAKIMRSEIPCQKVYEDAEILAFHDSAPKAPIHMLVIPKGPYTTFDAFVAQASLETVAHFWKTVGKIVSDAGVTAAGYRIVSNNGPGGGQEVPHFHVHILGGGG